MNKISKWAIIPILAGSLTFPQVIQAEQPLITVYVDNNKVVFDQSPVIQGDITLVPLRGVFEKLGAEVKWDSKTGKVNIVKDNEHIILQPGSVNAFINNAITNLSVKPQLINSRVMVPLRFVSEALDANVDWDAETRNISITQNSNLNNSSTNSNLPDTSKEQTVPNSNKNESALTYQQALNKAIAYSYDIKKAEKEIDRTEEVREDYGELFKYVSPFGTGNGLEDANLRLSYTGMLSAENERQIAKREAVVEEEQVTYKVKEAYNAILQKSSALKIAEESYKFSQDKKNIVDLQFKQGLVSNTQHEQMNNSVIQAEKNYEAAKKALDQAYATLNDLMGVISETRYSIVDVPDYKVLEDVNIDYKVTQVLEEHPSVFELEKMQELAKESLKFYSVNAGVGQTYKAKEIEASQIGTNLAQTKEKIALSVRNLYSTIKSLEDNYNALQSQLENAEKDLEVARLDFEVGREVAITLKEKELTINKLKQQINDLVIQLDNLHMVFEKPWVNL